MLRMKQSCERCGVRLGLADQAYICSYECTFCPQCSGELAHSCPNCQGELKLRPTRTTSPTQVPHYGFRAKLEKIL